jgi:hypothetical protein
MEVCSACCVIFIRRPGIRSRVVRLSTAVAVLAIAVVVPMGVTMVVVEVEVGEVGVYRISTIDHMSHEGRPNQLERLSHQQAPTTTATACRPRLDHDDSYDGGLGNFPSPR